MSFMKWLLRIYQSPDDGSLLESVEFSASTEITADKIALNIVEKEYPGLDWSLVKVE